MVALRSCAGYLDDRRSRPAQPPTPSIDLASKIGKPDCIVTDPFITAAALAAEALDVPLAVAGWPAREDMQEEYLFPVQKNLSTGKY